MDEIGKKRDEKRQRELENLGATAIAIQAKNMAQGASVLSIIAMMVSVGACAFSLR